MRDCKICLTRFAVVAMLMASIAAPAEAQQAGAVGSYWWSDYGYVPLYHPAYDPSLSLSIRVREQAYLMRAQAEYNLTNARASEWYATARKLNAQARVINADAYEKELDNWMKSVRGHWDRQIIGRKKKLELNHAKQISRLEYLNDKKWQNNRVWDRLKSHPDLIGASVKRGVALNFLLTRLSINALPYRFDPSQSEFSSEVLADLKIERDWLPAIMLKQGGVAFSADDFQKSEISSWPYYLRWDEFNEARTNYENARQEIVEVCNSNGHPNPSQVAAFQSALNRLILKFRGSEKVKEYAVANKGLTKWKNTDRFLAELDREIRRLEEVDDIRPFQHSESWSPQKDGDHIVALLTFMNRNGVEFTECKPGKEHVYRNLFTMMRSLYLTVENNDPSTQPENLSKRIPDPV